MLVRQFVLPAVAGVALVSFFRECWQGQGIGFLERSSFYFVKLHGLASNTAFGIF